MWWVAAGTQNLLQCTPNIKKQCLLSNRLQKTFSDLSHITTGTWLWKFILLAEDTYLITKQQAEWGLPMTERAAASQTLFWANSCNKHTLHSTVQPHSRYFCHSVLYRPRLRRRRPFFASRHLPEKVLSMKNMAFYINVNTDQRPKNPQQSHRNSIQVYTVHKTHLRNRIESCFRILIVSVQSEWYFIERPNVMVNCSVIWLMLFKYFEEVWVPRKYNIGLQLSLQPLSVYWSPTVGGCDGRHVRI